MSTQKIQFFHRFLQHMFLNVGSQTKMFVASVSFGAPLDRKQKDGNQNTILELQTTIYKW